MKHFLIATAAIAGLTAMAPGGASAITLQIIGGSPLMSPSPAEPGSSIPAGYPGFASGAQLEVIGTPFTDPVLQFFFLGNGDAIFPNVFSVNGTTAFTANSTPLGAEFSAPISIGASGTALINFALTSPNGTACNITANCANGQGTIPTTGGGVGDWLANAPAGFDGVYGGTFIGFADGGTGAGDADVYDMQVLVSAPEPATLTVFGAGLSLLGWARRRKKAGPTTD